MLDVGANLGLDQSPGNCGADCSLPTSLYMGGFQFMGAYKMGQLTGDRLVHVYATYMYRLSSGGLLGQKSFVGLVAERGDAWYANESFRPRNSLSLFVAVDSKIGDIYLGGARGSDGASNLFLQLGRRFSF